MKSENPQWKDFVGRRAVSDIAEAIGLVERKFDRAAFVKAVLADDLMKRELKDRIMTVARHLKTYLPGDYGRSVDILIAVAPRLNGWCNWVLTSYVEQFGLEHFEDSVRALEELTRHGTGEFAIRPFMIEYTDRMLPVLSRWAEHKNEHVRRLAAEGSRPRGVWVAHVEAFKANPSPVIKILDKLRADDSLYVRKAVANNLNDISKDHPELAIETASRWQKDSNKQTDWIIRHGCRSLIKQGHPGVFALLGFTADPKIRISRLQTKPRRVRIGKEMVISFEIRSLAKKQQQLVIDYKIHYVKSGGRLSAKVFKLAERKIGPGETVAITTRHSFVDRSTRKHFAGSHHLDLLINGVSRGSVEFLLTKSR